MSIPKTFNDACIRDWTHCDATNEDILRVRFAETGEVRIRAEMNTGDCQKFVEGSLIERMRREVLELVQDELIVKCRCCRYFNTQPNRSNDYGMFWCAGWRDYGASPDGYCAWGEKR